MLSLMVILIVLGISSSTQASDQNQTPERILKVLGDGKIKAVPDQSEMELQVTEEGTEVEDASALVQAKLLKVFKTLKSSGVLEKDTQTTSYSVSPKTKFNKGESIKVGYTVSSRVKVVIKDMDSTGKILKAVIQDGVNTVDGPYFSFSNPAQLKIDALKNAVEDAHAKAEAIAQTAGVDLGKVISISQSNISMTNNRQRMEYAAVNDLSEVHTQVPIATGENEVTAQVEVVYSLK